MTDIDLDARRAMAHVFNSAVAASAIGAAWEIGALDQLNEHGKLEIAQFAEDNDLDLDSTRAMFQALASVGIVERSEAHVLTGPLFAETLRTRSLFHWLVQGSGALFSAMSSVLRRANRHGRYYTRDAAAIGFACREINARFFDPVFWSVISGLDFPVRRVADLGSGSGQRLLDLMRAFPEATGIGVDVAAPVLEFADGELNASGLADRVTFVEADVLALQPRPEFTDVELLTCFMMGHDFWPRPNCVATLRNLRTLFPNARRFLIGETARNTEHKDTDLPVFTLGFELGHALMGVHLPTLADWHGVFAEGGWTCVHTHPVDTPAGSIIFELEPA
ncbi:methyltransferase domain-containing protein [Actinokineospora sp. NPDC004072]